MSLRQITGLFAVLAVLTGLGCSWSRTEEIERFNGSLIPLTVGVVLEDNRAAEAEGRGASDLLGPDIVGYIRAWNVFESVQFPYREGDQAEAILYLSVFGDLDTHDAAAFPKSFFSGLTFGITGTVIGFIADYDHEVDARLVGNNQLISSYSVQAETSVRVGARRVDWDKPEGQEALAKARRSHASRLAQRLAEKLERDRGKIIDSVALR